MHTGPRDAGQHVRRSRRIQLRRCDTRRKGSEWNQHMVVDSLFNHVSNSLC
jgi:hypothetical protein